MKQLGGLIKALRETAEQTDKAAKKFMRQEAQKERKRAVSLAKSRVKKNTGNYFKGFKAGKKIYKTDDADYNIRVYNAARHAHLIENGFQHSGGKWVPGKHILEDTHKSFEAEYAKDVEDDLADFMAKELSKW